MLVRLPDGLSPSDEQQLGIDIGTVMAQRMDGDDAVTALRVANKNSNVTFPYSFSTIQGALSPTVGIWEQDPESVFLSLVARGTTTGRKTRFEFFTAVKTPTWPGKNRYLPGDAAPVDTWKLNMFSILSGAPSSPVAAVSIGGDYLAFNDYVNIASNAYWQRQQRTS